MIAGKRKTIGVFMCKAYQMFDNAVYSTLEKEAQKCDLDVVIFTTVGYFASRNDYDSQEMGMFSFAPIEELDGIIIAPDTYEIDGFRDKLFETIRNRAHCPVAAIRHLSDEFSCVFTDEDNAIRPLLRHLGRRKNGVGCLSDRQSYHRGGPVPAHRAPGHRDHYERHTV